ncbi:MAG: hypothetical protein H6577_16410 [Lewinellaceae bacterium]|nr:hypothetical protein [Lewinellaceae bacterium]
MTYTYTDGNGCTGSCTFDISVDALDDASFSYPAASFCANGPDPSPTVTGLPGGTFTATPAGLVISAYSGRLTLAPAPRDLHGDLHDQRALPEHEQCAGDGGPAGRCVL